MFSDEEIKSEEQVQLENDPPVEETTQENNESKQQEKSAEAKNKKLCIFLGAGASAAAGYKTFLTFPHMFWPTSTEPAILKATEKERVLLASIRRELERKRKPLILDQYLWLLNDYHTVLQNIFSDEELRARFADSLLFQSKLHELNQLVQKSRKHICELTIDHYLNEPDPEYVIETRKFYRDVFKYFDEINLFTTNYDIVPEYLLSNNEYFKGVRKKLYKNTDRNKKQDDNKELIEDTEIQKFYEKDLAFRNGLGKDGDLSKNEPKKIFFEDCEFQKASSPQKVSPPKWHEKFYKRNKDEDSCNDKPKTFKVFRVHGCVAWYYEKQKVINASVEFIKKDDMKSENNLYDRLCVMYPGKEDRVGRNPHNYSFEQLYTECYNSEVILIVGFAFRDNDVLSVMFNAIRQSYLVSHRRKKIIVIDPFLDKDYIIGRLKEQKLNIPLPIGIDDNKDGSEYFEIVDLGFKFPPENQGIGNMILEFLTNSREVNCE